MDRKDFGKFWVFRKDCLMQAKKLVRSAGLLFNVGNHDIALHLGLLSLEELGKIFMTFVNYRPEFFNGEPVDVDIKNHISKLLWGLLAASDQKDLNQEKHMQLAEFIFITHKKRQIELYTDSSNIFNDYLKSIPVEPIAKSVLTMAHAAIMLEEDRIWRPEGCISLNSYCKDSMAPS